MDLLREFLDTDQTRTGTGDSENAWYELRNNLPGSYHATKEFGDRMLYVTGIQNQCIHDLFCIRTFALHHGISKALHLIRENVTSPSPSFPERLYNTSELPGVSKLIAADLERECLRWELAEDIPDPDSVITNSESKHIRSEAILKYSSIANDILTRTNDIHSQEFFREIILNMLEKCNLINLANKLVRQPPIDLLDKILRDDISPNVPDVVP
jgi:hypothetical protein